MQANGGALVHIEEPGRPGYTAEGQRAAANSVLSKGASWNRSNPWENAPIHLHQLLAPRLDAMGIADRHGYVCATTLLSRNRPAPTANVVYTYPAGGARHRFRETAAEQPYTPGERVGIPAGARTGPYLYVSADGPALTPFSQARITGASLAGPAGAVQLKVVDNFTSGLAGFIPTGGQLIPVAPLGPGTAYTAAVSMDVFPTGGAGAIPFSHRWSFTTTSLRPGLRAARYLRRGRLLSVTVRTRRRARGRVSLRVRRCAGRARRARCNIRHRVRVRHGRRGSLHHLSVRLPRPGRWAVRPQFSGTHGWGSQRLRAVRFRVR
jgi:hypothetical protein